MTNVILVLALIGVPFVVAEVRAHLIRTEIAQGQRVRCELEDTDMDMWEMGR